MKRFPLLLVLLFGGFLMLGADGCSSDPNVEGAKLDLRNKDYDRALENIDKALESNPQNAEAYALKGQVLQEMAFEVTDPQEHSQRLNEMVDAYNRALELDPEQADDINNRLTLAYHNELNRGVQAYNRAQQAEDGAAEFMTAATYFGNAATMRPDSVDAYVNQALSLVYADAATDAITPLEMAVERGGDIEPRIYTLLASLYHQTEQVDKVTPLLEQASNLYPDDPDIRSELLNAYARSGQVDRALDAYQKAVASEPDNKLYRYNYGSLLLEAEQYDEALEQLRKAVELDPQYASAHYNIGAAYINQAVAVNDEIAALDDRRMNSSGMSDSEKQQLEQQIEQLGEQRTELFREAIPSLERAKELSESAGEDPTAICGALFQAYAQTNQTEKAKEVSECAGYDDIN